jgi:hypothetical protein
MSFPLSNSSTLRSVGHNFASPQWWTENCVPVRLSYKSLGAGRVDYHFVLPLLLWILYNLSHPLSTDYWVSSVLLIHNSLLWIYPLYFLQMSQKVTCTFLWLLLYVICFHMWRDFVNLMLSLSISCFKSYFVTSILFSMTIPFPKPGVMVCVCNPIILRLG